MKSRSIRRSSHLEIARLTYSIASCGAFRIGSSSREAPPARAKRRTLPLRRLRPDPGVTCRAGRGSVGVVPWRGDDRALVSLKPSGRSGKSGRVSGMRSRRGREAGPVTPDGNRDDESTPGGGDQGRDPLYQGVIGTY